jgi:hypothetical protein
VPAAEVPDGREDQVDWLYDWWSRIDLWIGEHRPTALPRDDRHVGVAVRPTTAQPAGGSAGPPAEPPAAAP